MSLSRSRRPGAWSRVNGSRSVTEVRTIRAWTTDDALERCPPEPILQLFVGTTFRNRLNPKIPTKGIRPRPARKSKEGNRHTPEHHVELALLRRSLVTGRRRECRESA